MGEVADGIDGFVIETVEVRAEQAGESLDGCPAVDRLDDELLRILLGLCETEVGHEFDGEERIGRGPLGGPVSDEDKLHRPPPVCDDVVDPGCIGLGETARLRIEIRDLAVRLAAKTHLPHEEIDGEGRFVIGEALRDPALTDDPGHDHLDQTVGGVGGAEGAGESVVVVRPEFGDPVGSPGGLESGWSDGDFPSLMGEFQCAASGTAREVEHISEEGSLARRVLLRLQ